MRHLIPISGKDSLATALIQTAKEPSLPYEYFYNDTGAELPETYRWVESVEAKTGWEIKRIGQPLEARIHSYNGFLPGQKSRYCTREAKIIPVEKWLDGTEATIYYGLRWDEPDRKGYVPIGSSKIVPRYPLRESKIGLSAVYGILQYKDMLPPSFFWTRLFDAVNERLSGLGDWEGLLERWERDRLFSGRSRPNCYFCFFQRQSEFLWLLETHPDLYHRASNFEKADYTWQQGFRLVDFAANKDHQDKVFQHRVDEVCRTILKRLQLSLFDDLDSDIAQTSCGLLCGK